MACYTNLATSCLFLHHLPATFFQVVGSHQKSKHFVTNSNKRELTVQHLQIKFYWHIFLAVPPHTLLLATTEKTPAAVVAMSHTL